MAWSSQLQSNCTRHREHIKSRQHHVKRIQVKVKPNALTGVLSKKLAMAYDLACLKAAPADGKANDELAALIAQYFHRRKSAMAIKSGTSSRIKLIQIESN